MDFANLGINLAVIGGIIGVTEVIKLILPEVLKRFLLLVPTILGVVAAIALGWNQGWQGVVREAIVYVGTSTYIWKFGKTVVAGQ